jgi:YfiR/HmsC-like
MKPPRPRDAAQEGISRGHGICRRRSLLSRLAAMASGWVLIGLPGMLAQHSKPTEYEVKATYLYNFSHFVEWPAKVAEGQSDSFDICVLGRDPFGAALNATVAQETIAGKNVVARQIPEPEDAVNCRVLFISSSEDKRLKQILTCLGTASVLTVSDLPQFTEHGGMVQFVMEGNRVRFEVNSAIAERAGLTLSSELLKVATNVRRSVQLGD